LTRLYNVLGLVNRLLGEYHPVVKVIEHYTSENGDIEYFNIRIHFPQASALIMLREYWQREALMAYGYYIQIKGNEEWWDNRPHHPEIPTHPYHRHLEGKVHPLQDPSLEKFLERVKELLHKNLPKKEKLS